MRGSGWSNGKPTPSGSGYGVAISRADRDSYFRRSSQSVTLILDHGATVTVKLTDSFWRSCSEFRDADIGRWLLDQGLAPWPKGEPPTFTIEPVEEGVLRVKPMDRS